MSKQEKTESEANDQAEEKSGEPEAKESPLANSAEESARDPAGPVKSFELTPAIRNRWLSTGIDQRHAVYRGWGDSPWHKARWRIIQVLSRGEAVILGGQRGTAKTQILADTCLHFVTSNKRARYIHALDLAHRLRDAAMGEGAGLKNLHDWMQSMDLMAIDEIQDCSDTDFTETEFRLLIDKRYRAKKATIIAGNIDEESASLVLGDSIIRRVNDGGGMFMADWEPFVKEEAQE